MQFPFEKMSPIERDLLERTAEDDNPELHHVDPKKIHESVSLPNSWTDGEVLFFWDTRDEWQKKLLYYIGAENEATLVTRFGKLSAYEGVSLTRLARYTDSQTLMDFAEDMEDY